MAELTYKSAGVGVREIDLSAPTQASPIGTPAGIIGTADRGPAFVPVVVGNYREFTSKFGSALDAKMGIVAMSEWLRNAGSGLYIRVLGVGDSKKRVAGGLNSGRVENAGFVVGTEQVQSDGYVGANPYAYGSTGIGYGRTHFLGCFMSESAGSTHFSEAGIQTSSTAAPILRAVVLTPSGVSLAMASSDANIDSDLPVNSAPTQSYGFVTGTVDLSGSKQQFVLLLSGHISSVSYPNIITASFDPTAPNYFGNVFNSDPTKIESAGHYLMAGWDIHPALATVTGSGIIAPGSAQEEVAFVLQGGASHNSGSLTIPNFEGFEDRFQTARSPWVISQLFGGETIDLFKVHALDDGAWANTKVKISIRNLTPSSDPTSEYGTFDLFVRDFADSDDNQIVLESFIGMNLNPASQNYFARIIGDTHVYYDFDREEGSQKLVADGLYPNRSTYIRVQPSDSVQNGEVPATSLPFGFRGYWHIVSSGSGVLNNPTISALDSVKQPPVSFRRTIAQGTGTATRVVPYLHWGVQYEVNDSLTEPNKNNYSNRNAASNAVYFGTYQADFLNMWRGDVPAADSYNNNLFSVGNIQVITGTNGLPDVNSWHLASYSRDGSLSNSYSRFLQTSDLNDLASRKYIKFTFGLQGGFEGVNIFDSEKSIISNLAAHREMVDLTNQDGPAGPTVASYRKAVDVMAEKTDVDAQLVVIPGIRTPGVTDYALDAVENRFDALYIMDLPEIAIDGTVITGSDTIPSVTLTASTFKARQLDSSFGAAYYPDVVIPNPTTGIEEVAPASVAALGAFALNDKLAYPWFAPAGFTRGALASVIETQTKLSRDNMDTLYSANINPIATIPGSPSPIINGQKTLLNRASALDRVNVRRLLIEIRRRVKVASNQILFEPNRETTLARFSALVEPILKQIQAQSGVDRYLVKIDTTTTTQADVENNTIRGKIFVQPTKSIEFVSLDFVVTNAGATI